MDFSLVCSIRALPYDIGQPTRCREWRGRSRRPSEGMEAWPGVCLAIATGSLRVRAVTILQIVKTICCTVAMGPNPGWRVTFPGFGLLDLI
jgi:hypothetical protein